MKRLAAALAAAGALIAPAAAQAHTVSADKPVVFISGAESGAVDCRQHFDKIRERLRRMTVEIAGKPTRFTGNLVVVADNPQATNCNHTISATSGLMWSQTADLINWLWDTYSSKGQRVDIVAEGSAGVLVRHALSVAGKNPTFKDKPLKVEDVVTLGSPHAGSHALAMACPVREWCSELDPDLPEGAAFLKALAKAPQGQGGTDWTAIGSTSDELVTAESAIGMDADHKTLYEAPKLEHAELITDDATEKDATISYSHRGNQTRRSMKARHVIDRVAEDLVFGSVPVASDACTGSDDQPGGGVIVTDAGLHAWTGPQTLSYIRSAVLEAYSACFKKIADGRFASDTVVRLNGLDITPAPGTQIFIDAKKRRVTAQKMTMAVPTEWFDQIPIPLRRDAGLDWTLPKSAGTISDNDLDGTALPAEHKIAGMPIKGTHELRVEQGAMALRFELKLPNVLSFRDPDTKKELGGSLLASVRLDGVQGLMIDRIGGSVQGNLKLGPVQIDGGASFEYSRVENEWTATANARVPLPNNPRLTISLTMKDWNLKAIAGELDDINKPLGASGIFLQKVKLGYTALPEWKVTIGTALSVGPRFDGKSLAEWDGTLDITGTSTKLAGTLKLLDDEWGNGDLEIFYAGSATVNATIKKKKEYGGVKFDLDATAGGTVDGTGVDIRGGGKLCFTTEFTFEDGDKSGTGNRCLAQGTLRMSLKRRLIAITACGTIDVGIPIAGGVALVWKAPVIGDSGWTADAFRGCDVDEFHTPPAEAAQAGGAKAVSLDGGLRGAVIAVQGDGGPPRIALAGPGGERIAAPASTDGIVRGDGYAFVPAPANATTYVVLGNPRGGRWTIQAQPGSAPIAGVRYANVLPAPAVRARVRGHGRARTLVYDVTRIPGQVVRFREIAGDVVHTLGTARGSHGTLRFRPAFGRARTRRIVAHVEQRGLPRATLDVARYVAPKPAVPRAPRRVTLRRRGERLAIGWSPVAGASGYAVGVRTGDGRTLGFRTSPGEPRRIVVRDVVGNHPSRVVVRALRPDGVMGRARTVRGGA
ncbi:MAG TPA: hypothetical protein VFZ00_22255 [Solirubrobacter sp.]|nr:hypothetical protein [Solirubrobacter sp.]